MDSATSSPLQNVRIYYQDTIPLYSDKTGKFRINIKASDKLHFRKAGYAWHTETITGDEFQKIYLFKSDASLQEKLSKVYSREKTKIFYDDKLIPFEEFGDAFSTHSSEIESININSSRTKVILQSIFKWNKK
jgi:hypothetical protein